MAPVAPVEPTNEGKSVNDPTISVLIPAYNRAHTIARCLHSALNSNYQSLEVIVADNGSTDGTLEIARQAAAGDPRVSFISHPRNLGPLANWHSCLTKATGDLVHWLWSDDWIEPNFYRTLVDGMQCQKADMALCAARVTCPDEGWSYISHSLRPTSRDDLLQLALSEFRLPFSPAAALLPMASVRRHFTISIPQVGAINCNRRAIGADALMIIGSLYDSQKCYMHPDPLVYFRAWADSISISSSKLLATHYAWARLWWSRRHGIPRRLSLKDIGRLTLGGHPIAALRGLL
jgi:glycosyltransferase involved in cell wall biosynthesis